MSESGVTLIAAIMAALIGCLCINMAFAKTRKARVLYSSAILTCIATAVILDNYI